MVSGSDSGRIVRGRRTRALPSQHSPSQLIRQIILLQTFYYISLLLLILFTALVFGSPFSFSLLFSWRTIRGDTAFGWTICIITLLGGWLIGSIGLMVLVGRSKLVLDFVCTLHFIHAFIVIFLWNSPQGPDGGSKSGGQAMHPNQPSSSTSNPNTFDVLWPRNKLWWLLQAGSCVGMLIGGLAGCRWRELKPIGFGTGNANGKAANSASAGTLSSQTLQDSSLNSDPALLEPMLGRPPDDHRDETRSASAPGPSMNKTGVKKSDAIELDNLPTRSPTKQKMKVKSDA